MSGVFNEITIEWGGKRFIFTPSNRLLRRIEGELSPSSLTDVARRMNDGKPPISETAFIISEFLKAGGAEGDEGDEDQIYAAIMRDFAENDGNGFVGLCRSILTAISPADNTAKKPTAASTSRPNGEAAASSPSETPSAPPS